MDSAAWFAAGLLVGELAMLVALMVGERLGGRLAASWRRQWDAEDAVRERPSSIPPHQEPDVDDIASEESVDRYLDYMERRARTRQALNRSH